MPTIYGLGSCTTSRTSKICWNSLFTVPSSSFFSSCLSLFQQYNARFNQAPRVCVALRRPSTFGAWRLRWKPFDCILPAIRFLSSLDPFLSRCLYDRTLNPLKTLRFDVLGHTLAISQHHPAVLRSSHFRTYEFFYSAYISL